MQVRRKRSGLIPSVRKITCRRAYQSSPGFLPGESHGPRSLAGYSPWDCKDSDMTVSNTQSTHGRRHQLQTPARTRVRSQFMKISVSPQSERTSLSHFLFFPRPSSTMAWSKTTAWWAWVQESYHKLLFLLCKYSSLTICRSQHLTLD